MWQSLRISHLLLRLSLAGFFLWAGLDKLFGADHWLNTLIPASAVHFAAIFHVSSLTLVYGLGIIEFLIAISLASNMFVELFAFVGAILLICTPFFYGFSEVVISNMALAGGLLALAFWPSQKFRRY